MTEQQDEISAAEMINEYYRENPGNEYKKYINHELLAVAITTKILSL